VIDTTAFGVQVLPILAPGTVVDVEVRSSGPDAHGTVAGRRVEGRVGMSAALELVERLSPADAARTHPALGMLVRGDKQVAPPLRAFSARAGPARRRAGRPLARTPADPGCTVVAGHAGDRDKSAGASNAASADRR
jgi:hypothetical protein